MSLDLYERDISERMSGLRPITAPEPGAFDNFLYSAGTAAMRTFASTARAGTMAAGGVVSAVERLGAMHPLSDGTVDRRLSDAVWKFHDDVTQRAVDYWTPNPNEVGVAGQVVGQLLATLPMVALTGASGAVGHVALAGTVGATQLGTAEDVMRKGVEPGKAQAVGAVQAAGLGLGIWMPILGQNLWQRVVLGGAGFNVVQGAATRGISGEILEGTPAAEEFNAFDPAALTLDVLLGAAFGGIAHLSPSQRAQGKAMLDRIQSWGKDLKPSDVDALQVVRQAQHMNVDSMPGKPVDVQDIEAHVQRVKAAIDQLSGDRPVQVDDLPAARVEADQARTAEQQANLSVLQELGERVRRLERIPLTPDEITARAETIGTRIAEELQAAGRTPEESTTVGKVWEAFFATAAKRYGVDPQQLFDTYRVAVRPGEAGGMSGAALRQISPDIARTLRTPVEMPADPVFSESVGNTPGAKITDDGLLIDLVRFQKPEQEGGRAIRTGVFYLPSDSPQIRGYKGGNKAYGGTEKYQGETLLRRPLFVKGATGGKAPEAAYDQIMGKGAYNAMRQDALAAGRNYAEPRSSKAERVAAVLEKYGADRNMAWDIVENSTQGNTLSYAIQENIVAHAVREAGYDSVVGYSKGRSGNRISEVFDVRELTYPSNVLNPEIHNRFEQSAVENLQMVAERGERVTAQRAIISQPEKNAIAASANAVGVSSAEIERAVREHKMAHPLSEGWAPLIYNRTVVDDGKVVHEYKKIPYDFSTDKSGNQLKPGTPEYDRRVAGAAKAMVEDEYGVRAVFRRALAGDKNAQNIIAQAGWYKAMRLRLRKEFGGLGDLFADLLGATSPNTPVRDNWSNAIDSLRRAMRGDFDALMPKWEAWVVKADEADAKLRAWLGENMARLSGEEKATEPDRVRRITEIDNAVDAARKAYEAKRVAEEKANPTGFKLDKVGKPTSEIKPKTLADIRKEDGWKQLNRNADKKAIRDEALAYGKGRLLDSEEFVKLLDEAKAARELPDELLPAKESGAKYGFNGRNVVRAMVDLWRTVKDPEPDLALGGTAPKALNFSGNLIGFRERATIDVWAARMLQRLTGGLRIPSMAETGVSGKMLQSGDTTLQFGFGQDVFTKAVELIRNDPELASNKTLANINDDDLQAVVWFIEKELWTNKNWTSVAGEGGSFELEANLTGPKNQERIKELRKILDSSKSSPEAKAEAKKSLIAMERTIDRYMGGLSIQKSMDTQGVDYVPTDADMARLSNRVRMAAYEADDGATVLGSKALTTQGRYGSIERSIDLELLTREGYDPNPLWREILIEARDADQDSTFLSRVLRDGEDVDYSRHRPGVEIYFREAAAKEKIEAMVKALADKGVEFFTVIVDGRRMGAATSGEMPPAVGVRFQYVPEFEQRYGMDNLKGLSDAELQAKIKAKGAELSDLAQKIAAEIDGVSFAGRFWYDTQVAFRHEYQGKIDALSARNTPAGSAASRAQAWAGRPIREGIENADRAANEAARREPNVGARAVLGVDAQASPDGKVSYEQGGPAAPRGAIEFGAEQTLISLFKSADESTFLHESGHFFLQVTKDLASRADAPEGALNDWSTLAAWLKNEGGELTRGQQEQFARGFEAYLGSGEAPTPALKGVFERFKDWLLNIYKSLTSLDVKLSDDVRAVMGRMLSDETEARPAPRPAEPPRSMAEEQGGAEVIEANQLVDNLLSDLRAAADEDAAARALASVIDDTPSAPTLDDPEVRAHLLRMRDETGWAEIGGKIIRDPSTGAVTGRTRWVPHAEWWPGRPDGMNETRTQAAIDKAIGGEPLRVAEQRMIAYMLKYIDEAILRPERYASALDEEYRAETANALLAEDLEPTAKNITDADLVARAVEFAPDRVENAAIRFESDDSAFMAEIKAILREQEQNRKTAGGRQETRAAAQEQAAETTTTKTADESLDAGQTPDPLAYAAERIANERPDLAFTIGRDADGNPVTTTVRQYLDDVRADVAAAMDDARLFEAAAVCLLGKG